MSLINAIRESVSDFIRPALKQEGNKEQYWLKQRNATKVNFPKETLFISISNEWTPLSLVEVVDYMENKHSTLPIIKDLQTNEEFIGFTKLMPYSDALITLLKPMNPFQRYTVVTGQDITNKTLFLDKPGVETELKIDELIDLAKIYQKKHFNCSKNNL